MPCHTMYPIRGLHDAEFRQLRRRSQMTEQQRDWSSHDLVWGVKDSFVEYISSLPDGVIAPFGGAEEYPQAGHKEWLFPFTRQETEGGSVRIEFGGELRIRG